MHSKIGMKYKFLKNQKSIFCFVFFDKTKLGFGNSLSKFVPDKLWFCEGLERINFGSVKALNGTFLDAVFNDKPLKTFGN